MNSITRLLVYISIIDNSPDIVKETYFKMKGEQKKLELNVKGGNYNMYVVNGLLSRKKKKLLNEIILTGSIDIDGTERDNKRTDEVFSPRYINRETSSM